MRRAEASPFASWKIAPDAPAVMATLATPLYTRFVIPNTCAGMQLALIALCFLNQARDSSMRIRGYWVPALVALLLTTNAHATRPTKTPFKNPMYQRMVNSLVAKVYKDIQRPILKGLQGAPNEVQISQTIERVDDAIKMARDFGVDLRSPQNYSQLRRLKRARAVSEFYLNLTRLTDVTKSAQAGTDSQRWSIDFIQGMPTAIRNYRTGLELVNSLTNAPRTLFSQSRQGALQSVLDPAIERLLSTKAQLRTTRKNLAYEDARGNYSHDTRVIINQSVEQIDALLK